MTFWNIIILDAVDALIMHGKVFLCVHVNYYVSFLNKAGIF